MRFTFPGVGGEQIERQRSGQVSSMSWGGIAYPFTISKHAVSRGKHRTPSSHAFVQQQKSKFFVAYPHRHKL